MKNQSLQQRPTYPIQSVDNALRLLQLLRDGGQLRLSDATQELGVSKSAAHRLLAMLVYRGFAIQDDHRRYVSGPAFGVRAIGAPWVRDLRQLAMEPMTELGEELEETVNLMIRVGGNVRFLASIEPPVVLRVGDRTGSVLPALTSSGGKALLALEPLERLRSLYQGRTAQLTGRALSSRVFHALLRELEGVRSAGYAVNREETEAGVGAVGVAVFGPNANPIAAISVSAPIARLDKLLAKHPMERVLHFRNIISALANDLEIDQSDGYFVP